MFDVQFLCIVIIGISILLKCGIWHIYRSLSSNDYKVVCFLNVRGLVENKKRRETFLWLRQKGYAYARSPLHFKHIGSVVMRPYSELSFICDFIITN